jgi:hypothetical protein
MLAIKNTEDNHIRLPSDLFSVCIVVLITKHVHNCFNKGSPVIARISLFLSFFIYYHKI